MYTGGTVAPVAAVTVAALLLLWRARRRGVARLRQAVIGDEKDVAEMAAMTYSGHDWIMSEFSNWMATARQSSLTLGIEVGGHLRALENIRLVDDGRTGWLEALRVHPQVRRRGYAARLQGHLMAQAKLAFPSLQRFRYTTAGFNAASLRLAALCGLQPVHRWGFVLLSDHASSEQPETSSSEDVKLAAMSPGCFGARLREELARAGVGVPISSALDPCSAAEILAAEARASDGPPGLIFDWKVADLSDRMLEELLSSAEAAGLEGGYTIGKTRPDFEGRIRVFNAVPPSHAKPEEQWRVFLRLAIHEADAAARDEANTLMGFFPLGLMDRLVATGLADAEKVCVLLEGSRGGYTQ